MEGTSAVATRRQKPKQFDLPLAMWGGKRKGAGRKPKGEKAGVSHVTRERFGRNQPVHVTLRVRRDVPSLRGGRIFKTIRASFAASCEKPGFRLTHFSVQGNHAHLVVEADAKEALSRGIQGLCTRMARRLNRQTSRCGAVFADRYHAHVLRTPRDVRNAIGYVRHTYRHHVGEHVAVTWVDPCSSWGSAGSVVSSCGWLLRSERG